MITMRPGGSTTVRRPTSGATIVLPSQVQTPVQYCECASVNGGEPIDWRTENCGVCGLPVRPPGGGV